MSQHYYLNGKQYTADAYIAEKQKEVTQKKLTTKKNERKR